MWETKVVLKNNNERECGLTKISTYGNVNWMLLMFDLACRELQNPLEEWMPFHGFLCKSTSPTEWEPCWGHSPLHTLPVSVGRDIGSFEERTGLFCRWKLILFTPRSGNVKMVLLLVAKGPSGTVLMLHCKSVQSPLPVCFQASLFMVAKPHYEVLCNPCSQYSSPGLSWRLCFVT